MRLSTATGLIGLIVMESPGTDDEPARETVVSDDATLAQILARLARGNPATPAASRATERAEAAARFGRLGSRGLVVKRPSRVKADCRSLGDELEHATRQLRRTIRLAAAR